MVRAQKLPGAFVEWARHESSIRALVLIGSQCRESSDVASADEFSDWDFQVVTSRPELFAQREWIEAAGLSEPIAYVVRLGRLESASKVTVIFPEGDLDLVLLPAGALRAAKWIFRMGLGARLARIRPALGDLALVLSFGLRVMKGGSDWEIFLRRLVRELPSKCMDDHEVACLVEGFVADYVSTCQKIDRGELIAAQRWLHVQLAETNFRLMHELRRRRGQVSYPDARRIESLHDAASQAALAVGATLDRESLKRAVEHSAQSFREIAAALIGTSWRWPERLSLRLRAE